MLRGLSIILPQYPSIFSLIMPVPVRGYRGANVCQGRLLWCRTKQIASSSCKWWPFAPYGFVVPQPTTTVMLFLLHSKHSASPRAMLGLQAVGLNKHVKQNFPCQPVHGPYRQSAYVMSRRYQQTRSRASLYRYLLLLESSPV